MHMQKVVSRPGETATSSQSGADAKLAQTPAAVAPARQKLAPWHRRHASVPAPRGKHSDDPGPSSRWW